MTKKQAQQNARLLVQLLGGSRKWKIGLYSNTMNHWHYTVFHGCVSVSGYHDITNRPSYTAMVSDAPGAAGSPCHYNGVAHSRNPRIAVIKACQQFTVELLKDVKAFNSVLAAMESLDTRSSLKIGENCRRRIRDCICLRGVK